MNDHAQNILAWGGFLTATVAAIVSLFNAWNLRRVEKNTNSISERSELMAKRLGIEQGKTQGKAQEKRNPS